jgi:hypothetical protein
MKPVLITAALAACALAVPAEATQRGESTTSVRNDSDETLNCRIGWRGRSSHRNVVLRAGETWRAGADDPTPRSIYCDPPAASVRYRLREGRAYRLVNATRSVRIVLRLL